MATVWSILKTIWIGLLLIALVVPIMASCTGNIPRIDGTIQIDFEAEQKGEELTPLKDIDAE